MLSFPCFDVCHGYGGVGPLGGDLAGEVDYAVEGNRMEIRIPRALLNLSGSLDFEFKWSDNMQDEGNIMDFYSNGDVAPGGRFNFVYTE